jgi:hypothetical protein
VVESDLLSLGKIFSINFCNLNVDGFDLEGLEWKDGMEMSSPTVKMFKGCKRL